MNTAAIQRVVLEHTHLRHENLLPVGVALRMDGAVQSEGPCQIMQSYEVKVCIVRPI